MQPQRGHDPQVEGSCTRVNVLLAREGPFTLRRMELGTEKTCDLCLVVSNVNTGDSGFLLWFDL